MYLFFRSTTDMSSRYLIHIWKQFQIIRIDVQQWFSIILYIHILFKNPISSYFEIVSVVSHIILYTLTFIFYLLILNYNLYYLLLLLSLKISFKPVIFIKIMEDNIKKII